MTKKITFMLGLLLAAAGIAAAAKFVDREMPCPVCGKIFYAKLDPAPYGIEDVRDFKRTLAEKLKLRLKKLLKYVTEAGDKEAEAASLKRKSIPPGAEPR